MMTVGLSYCTALQMATPAQETAHLDRQVTPGRTAEKLNSTSLKPMPEPNTSLQDGQTYRVQLDFGVIVVSDQFHASASVI